MNNSTVTSHPDKHRKDAFEKISPEKQKKILEAAVAEFAGKGFSEANINVIAKNAGISIGSMYNYFESKENLFLAVVDYGYKELETVLSTVDLGKGDIFDKFEMLIRIAQQFSKQRPQLNQIYLDLASQGLYHLSQIDVTVGQRVKQGQAVAKIGSTGLSTGSHLHWDVRIRNMNVDPLQWTRRIFP